MESVSQLICQWRMLNAVGLCASAIAPPPILYIFPTQNILKLKGKSKFVSVFN